MLNFDLSQDIECYLLTQQACSEYDIIRHLQEIKRLPLSALSDSLSMFRCHFLVFNALHRIKLKWQSDFNCKTRLEISSLRIWVHAYDKNESITQKSKQQETTQFDPLSLFYLDLSQLNQTTQTDIHKLLEQFWVQYSSGSLETKEKQQALSVLELNGDVDFNTVKKQYRRLAMRHHPDRGGDENKLIAINQAMARLENYY